MNDSDHGKLNAFIGLGSNLTTPVEQINVARQEIGALENVEEVTFSSLYKSPPMGPQDQPDYINAVMCVKTKLSAMELLKKMQTIENSHGRIREKRWGARTLDLDLLLYGQQRINESDLVVPHAGIAERAFVLYPLYEIAGDDLDIPGLGTLGTLLEKCPQNGLQRIST